MHRLLIALAASAALAAPASAHDPLHDPAADARLVESLPSSADVEAIAPVLDRSVDAMLELDVGPLMDAVDPYGHHPGYRRPGRTLRNLGRRDDPYFDRRIRSQIYGTTAELGRMMDSFAIAAPALRRSMAQFELGIAAAVDDYRRRRGPPPPDWRVDEPDPDEDPYYYDD